MSQKAIPQIKRLQSANGRSIWIPLLKRLLNRCLFVIMAAFVIAFLCYMTMSGTIKNRASMVAWCSTGFADGGYERMFQSPEYNQRLTFANKVLNYSDKRMFWFGGYLMLAVGGLWIITDLILQAFSTVTQVLLVRRGFELFKESTLHFDRMTTRATILATFLVVLAIIIYYSNFDRFINNARIFPLILWIVAACFLIWYGIESIQKYRTFKTNLCHEERRYLLVTGAHNALICIFYIWFILFAIELLAKLIMDGVASFRSDIQRYAVEQALLTLSSEDMPLALDAVSFSLNKDKLTLMAVNALQPIPLLSRHVVRVILLLMYVVLAGPFCALRYHRPHLSFWVGGFIIAMFAYGFGQIHEIIIQRFQVSPYHGFFMVLAGVAIGFYIGFLLKPIIREG